MDIRFVARTADGRIDHDSLADHARRRLQFRLMRRSDRVAHVSVRIGGPGSYRGRQDTYCVMQVQVRGTPAATVVDIGANAYDTIDRTLDRDYMMSAQEAKDFGLIDQVLDKRPTPEAIAA